MSTTTTAPKYRIKGSDDHETTCACCGRTDLKRVIWLTAIDADGNDTTVEAYGTTCAARLLTPKSTASTSRHLTNLAKAISFIKKYNTGEYTLRQIANGVHVKFGVWATVEDDVLSVNTGHGWLPVVSR